MEGLATLRELEIFKANEISNAQTRGFHGTLNFSSTCLKRMPQIAENGIQSIDSNCDQGRDIINENGSTKCHMPSFNNEFWDNSSFNAQKVESEDEIMFSTTNGLESQVYILLLSFLIVSFLEKNGSYLFFICGFQISKYY